MHDTGGANRAANLLHTHAGIRSPYAKFMFFGPLCTVGRTTERLKFIRSYLVSCDVKFKPTTPPLHLRSTTSLARQTERAGLGTAVQCAIVADTTRGGAPNLPSASYSHLWMVTSLAL